MDIKQSIEMIDKLAAKSKLSRHEHDELVKALKILRNFLPDYSNSTSSTHQIDTNEASRSSKKLLLEIK